MKIETLSLALVVLLTVNFSSYASNASNLQKIIDSVYKEHYVNDTIGFQMAHWEYNSHHWRQSQSRRWKHGDKDRERVNKLPMKRLENVALRLLHSGISMRDVYYKRVEDGVLMIGKVFNGYFRTYFIGYDNRIVLVREDVIPPPNKYFVNIKIDSIEVTHAHPQTEEDVIYPEYLQGGIEGLRRFITTDMENHILNNRIFDYRFLGESSGKMDVCFYVHSNCSVRIKSFSDIPEYREGFNLYWSIRTALVDYKWIPGSIDGQSTDMDIRMTIHCTTGKKSEYYQQYRYWETTPLPELFPGRVIVQPDKKEGSVFNNKIGRWPIEP